MQSVLLLNWQRGVRMRLTIAATVAMIALWFIDLRSMSTPDPTLGYGEAWGLAGVFSIMLPSMTVLSLWWWDVIVALNRARAAESHLAATQERLRMATDVHDLQGHHLQVIALQLELAERLMPTDQDAALAQLRLARTSVDEARQGTRDLATQFRSVPLRDEIANAVDLLRAAGTSAESTVDAAADAAPASVLGPVIRETTTNVLRHGAGEWARLSLTRADGAWRYEIANDRLPDAVDSADGAGLDGIARRTGEVGGTVEIDRGEREFSVVVIVPEQTR
jgi:two-component system sensor histidine kinase DesK